jgi:hypothetical protein
MARGYDQRKRSSVGGESHALVAMVTTLKLPYSHGISLTESRIVNVAPVATLKVQMSDRLALRARRGNGLIESFNLEARFCCRSAADEATSDPRRNL